MIDVLFISPGNSTGIYQDLSETYSAIEPPTWALLLSQSCRSVGFNVSIIDINAERLNKDVVIDRILKLNPRLICFVVYGQNVNAGTVNMSGATFMSKYIKEKGISIPISFIGSYIQALPIKTLKDEGSIDFGFTNEGVYAIRNLLSQKSFNDLRSINGIVWRDGNEIVMNPPEKSVPNNRMDIDLPGYAWDLLPYKKTPLDLYRSPLWHAEYKLENRTPYAAIQTSLGCQFACNFCMINILNRNDNDEIGVAGNYSNMRYWSPEFIINEFDKLVKLGVYTIKITDEMFLLYKKYYQPLCEALAKKPYSESLKMWSYSRVDTITNPEVLKIVRAAGIRWLALGIESAEKSIRLEVTKGKFEDVDIERVVRQVEAEGINVMANYIVGLPGENAESMEKTLALSKKLNTAGWNMYAAMALPGSELYSLALKSNYDLPQDYSAFSFHSYDTLPLRNEHLSAREILEFRDRAYVDYHSSSDFQELIRTKFGPEAVANMKENLKVRLERKLISN